MSDIVQKLRALEAWIRKPDSNTFNLNTDVFDEAAAEIERLREWNAEIALNARHFAEALRQIAEHPTGGVGCNPEGFVRAARAALEGVE